MNTKLQVIIVLTAGLALQFCPAATAQNFDAGLGSPIPIPDANYTLGINGIASQIDVGGVDGMIDSVTVTLDITGDPTAYNGDYYAYLQFEQNRAWKCCSTTSMAGTGSNAGDGMDRYLERQRRPEHPERNRETRRLQC